MTNRLNSLKEYISSNETDSGDCWEYQHLPFLIEYLSQFNEMETEELVKVFLTWSEFHIDMMADIILFSDNKYLDKRLLYAMAFSKINEVEALDYLVENLWLDEQDLKKMEAIDLIELRNNLMKIFHLKVISYQERITLLVRNIETEMKSRI